MLSDLVKLEKGLICLVHAVKLELSLIDVYIIRIKPTTTLISGYYSANEGIPDIRPNRPELWIFSRVMLHFLYCCYEMVHLDFK